MKKTKLAAAPVAVLFAALVATALPVAPALGDPPSWAPANGRRGHDTAKIYDQQGRYASPRPLNRNSQVWRGGDGRYHCRRDNGTTGLVVGAVLGGVLGSQIAGRNDRTLGAILGAAGGGLLGREIDRGNVRCR